MIHHWWLWLPVWVAMGLLGNYSRKYFVVTWKLVRDAVPDQIRARGARMSIVQLQGEAYRKAITKKLIEEAREVGKAKTRYELIDEFADLLEVFDAYRIANGIPQQDINVARVRKYTIAGGFTKGYFLRAVIGRPRE